MWIEIKKDIFESGDSKGFNFIYQLLTWSPANSIPRYNVLIDFKNIENLDLYKSLSKIDKELIIDEYNAFVTSNPKIAIKITNKNSKSNHFNIEESVRFFIQPVSIILENSKNDACFIKTLIYFFDEKMDNGQQKLVEHIRNGWIQFENAGGCTNVENFIEGKVQSFNELAAINGKKNHHYLRSLVILDSDKEYPTSKEKPTQVKVKEEANKKGVYVHVLRKRAMENYMPDEVIQNIPSMKKSFASFRNWTIVYDKLSKLQKDYLNFKDGFSKKKIEEPSEKFLHGKKVIEMKSRTVSKERNEQETEIQTLYSNLTDSDYKVLDYGLKLHHFKDDFPTLFENNYLVHRKSLLDREGGTPIDNEFLEIISKIKDLL